MRTQPHLHVCMCSGLARDRELSLGSVHNTQRQEKERERPQPYAPCSIHTIHVAASQQSPRTHVSMPCGHQRYAPYSNRTITPICILCCDQHYAPYFLYARMPTSTPCHDQRYAPYSIRTITILYALYAATSTTPHTLSKPVCLY